MQKELKRTPNPPSPGPTGSASWWITKELPDDEITVLIRLKDDGWPVVLGWHEDGQWRDTNADEVEESKVTGWMHLHEAAAILDAQNYLIKRKVFRLSAYWGTNAERLALILNMA